LRFIARHSSVFSVRLIPLNLRALDLDFFLKMLHNPNP